MASQKYFKTRSDCNKHLKPREHYTKKNGRSKPKKGFKSEVDAQAWIRKYKMSGYVPYVCGVCGEWHVGKMKNNL